MRSKEKSPLVALDIRVTRWMARYGVQLLRWSLGIIFLWFGVLKFFPGSSPAESLATLTISTLTRGQVPSSVALPLLAGWECIIGIGLLTGRLLRVTLTLLFVQMLGTLMPLILFPKELFDVIPFKPTLEGQYIIKNLVLISAGVAVGATVRGGHLESDPGRG